MRPTTVIQAILAGFLDDIVRTTLAFEKAGEDIKGQQLTVSGRMQSRSYETQNGQQRTVVEVTRPNLGTCRLSLYSMLPS